MDSESRYAAMLAMHLTFPWLVHEPGWAGRLDEARRATGADKEGLEDLTARAARAVVRAGEELGPDALPSARKMRRRAGRGP